MIFDLKFWNDSWEAFMKAPLVVIPLLFLVAFGVWRFRDHTAKSTIEALREQNEAQEKRRLLAEESKREIEKEIEKGRSQIAKLETQIKAKESMPVLAQTTMTLDQSFKLIESANNALGRALVRPDIYNSAGGTANRPMDLEKK